MNKKLISVLLALILLLAGCGGGSSGGEGSGGGESPSDTAVLYHAFVSVPYVTLEPSTENSNGIMILQNVYETLTRYNEETGDVDPYLATKWSANEDGTQWVFQIMEGVTFHDGTDLKAQNVVNSIQRTIDKGAGAAFIWDSVESIEATGEYEVTFHLTYAAPLDLIASGGYAAYIMSDSVLDKDVEWFNQGNDGGSGPYTIAQATGDSVVLKAYEEYRGGWRDDQYKNIMIKEVAESSARRQLLETGEAQISAEFSSTDLAAMRGNDALKIYEANTFTNVLLCLNTQSEPMSNADFRRAVAYAFPYTETVENVMEGAATQSHGMVPNGLWGHDESLFQYTTDLDKARECLEKSGIDPATVTLEMTYLNGFDEYANWGQLLQVNLNQLGIKLDLRSMEWDAQWANAQNTDPASRQDIFVFQWWPDYASPASWFDVLVHSEEEIFFNLAYVNDPELDALCEEANRLTVTDRGAAEQKYIEIQQRLVEECQYIFPYDAVRIYAHSPGISGVYENPAYATTILYYNVTRNA